MRRMLVMQPAPHQSAVVSENTGEALVLDIISAPPVGVAIGISYFLAVNVSFEN